MCVCPFSIKRNRSLVFRNDQDLKETLRVDLHILGVWFFVVFLFRHFFPKPVVSDKIKYFKTIIPLCVASEILKWFTLLEIALINVIS